MNAFNRVFAVLAGLALLALGAGVIYLMWEPDRTIDVNNKFMQVMLDFSLSGSDRILATLIVAAEMSIGVLLVAAQAISGKRGARVAQTGAAPADEARFQELHRRLDDLQKRVDQRGADHGTFAPQPAQLAHQPAYQELPKRRWSLIDHLSR